MSKRDKRRERIDWDLLNVAWPKEDRPKHLQKRENVRGRNIDELIRLKREVVGEEEKKELGDSAFCKDAVVRKTKYKAAKDDGYKRLHPARSNRQPLAVPSEWYGKLVPVKRTVIVRNFPIEHYGAAGQVSDKTLGKCHNRAVDLTFDQFCKQNVLGGKDTELSMNQVEAGLHNYTAILHALWPQDWTGIVLQRLLFEVKWAEFTGLEDKKRVRLVRTFLTEVLKTNAGRAIHRQPPLEYDQLRAKWLKAVEANVPGGFIQKTVPAGGGFSGQSDGASRGRGRGRGRGGAATTSGTASRARGGSGRGGATFATFGPTATLHGIEVCFRFNAVTGCQRTMATPRTCKEGNRVFVHACDWLDPATNKHCLKDHARHQGGH